MPSVWDTMSCNNVVYQPSNKPLNTIPRTNIASILPSLLAKNVSKTDFTPLLAEEDIENNFKSDVKLFKELDRWVALLEAWPDKHITLDRTIWLRLLHKLRTSNQIRKESHIELCVFCRNNNEPFEMYVSHKVKDTNGKVTCPVLRKYICPICNCTGDYAHTIKYCPFSANFLKLNVNNSSEELGTNQLSIKSKNLSQTSLGTS